MSAKVQITVRLSADEASRVDILAEQAATSRAVVLRRALVAGLDLAAVNHSLNVPRVAVIMETLHAGMEVLLERNDPGDREQALRIAEQRFYQYHAKAKARG